MLASMHIHVKWKWAMNRRRRGTSQDASFVCPCRFCSKLNLRGRQRKFTDTHSHSHSHIHCVFRADFFTQLFLRCSSGFSIKMLLATSSRLHRPLWPILAAAALFGTFSGPRHLTQESHPETGRRCARAAMSRPAAHMLGHEPEPLTAVAPPVRAGTGAAGAVDARRRASMVHQMASATMAAPEPSTRCAASAPTALTAALDCQLIFRLLWPRPTRHHRACRPLTP